MSDLYRDFIDQKADQIINSLGGTITPEPANAELYRDFLDRKFDDVINAIDNVKVKSFTYTGDGNTANTIHFPYKPKMILNISGGSVNSFVEIINCYYGQSHVLSSYGSKVIDSTLTNRWLSVGYNDNDITFTAANELRCANGLDIEYTVYYI